MKRGLFRTIASVFAVLGIIFIPFPFFITKAQLGFTDLLFGKLISFLSSAIFGKTLSSSKVYSDSFSMYILVLVLLVLSVIAAVLLTRVKNWDRNREKIFSFIYSLAVYYLALQLVKYGADKIFKNQFYLPEPNILYTPLGKLDKDILYWSAMGTSDFYPVFLGVLELLSALLLLIRRTRLLGLLLALGILVNVVAINFGFDISVKLFSLFLLFLTVCSVLPYGQHLKQLLMSSKSNQHTALPYAGRWLNNIFLYTFLKCLAIGLICLEVFYPYSRTGVLNAGKAERPFLHGAYDIKYMVSGTDTISASDSPIKSFFIHKDSYLIFQDQDDQFRDYKLSYRQNDSVLILTDYQLQTSFLRFDFQSSDSTLVLHESYNGQPALLVGKARDWRKFPALKKGFRWTVD